MAWLVLFMTHVASYKAAAVIETAELSQGGTIFDHTDPNLRRKLAKRLGMDQHSDDVKVVKDAVAEAAEASAAVGAQEAEQKSSGSGSGTSSSADDVSDASDDDDMPAGVSGVNFRVTDRNSHRFEKKVDAYETASRKIAGWLRTALLIDGEIDTEIATAWEEGGVTLASVDGAKMLRIVIEVVRGENFYVLKGDWQAFKQEDDALAVFLQKFMYFASLFSFFGVGMKSDRKLKMLVKKLNAKHRGLVINAVSFADAMTTLRRLVKHEKGDEIDRKREDEVSARRALARRADERQHQRNNGRGSNGGRGRGGGSGRGGERGVIEGRTCHWCKKVGHITPDCPSKQAGNPKATEPRDAAKAKARKVTIQEQAPAAPVARKTYESSADSSLSDDDDMVYLPREPKARRVVECIDDEHSDADSVSSGDEDESKSDSHAMSDQAMLAEEASFEETDIVHTVSDAKVAVKLDAKRAVDDKTAAKVSASVVQSFLCRGPQIPPAGVLLMIILAFLVKAVFAAPISQQMIMHGGSNAFQHWEMVPGSNGVTVNFSGPETNGNVTDKLYHDDIGLPHMCAAHEGSGYNSECNVVDVVHNTSMLWFQVTPGFGLPEVQKSEPRSTAMRYLHVNERSIRVRPWVSWTSDLGICSATGSAVVTVIVPFCLCASCTVGAKRHCDKSQRTYLPRLQSSTGPKHRRKPSSLPHAKVWRRRVRAANVTPACPAVVNFENAVARPAKCKLGRRFNPRNPRSLPSCLDSGSTHHVGTNRACFGEDYKEVRGRSIGTAAQGRSCPIIGTGTMYIDAVDVLSGAPCVLELPGALHVPDFEQSLISTPCLEAAGHRVVHDRNDPKAGITVRDSSGKDVLHINTSYDGRQYVLDGEAGNGTRLPAARRCLHSVLAHCNSVDARATLKRSTGLVDAVDSGIKCCDCTVCAAAKMTESAHSKVPATPIPSPGMQIHVDICVMPVKSFSGARYNLTATCAATGYMWEFALKHRSEAGAVVEDLADELSKLLSPGHNVRVTVRSDNELAQGSFLRAAKKQGWINQSSSPNSSFQNGKGERPFRTIVAAVRAMLIEAKLGPAFWEYAYTHAVYLENRIARGGRASSYEQCFGKVPDFSNVHPFGELVACWVQPLKRNKLQPRCHWGLYVGKSSTHPSDCVLVFMPQTKRCINTRSFKLCPRASGDNEPGIQRWRFAPTTYGTPACPINCMPQADGLDGPSVQRDKIPDRKQYVGKSFRKNFGKHGWFSGTVQRVGRMYAYVVYDDGDSEEITFGELDRLLAVPKRRQASHDQRFDPVRTATVFKPTPEDNMTVRKVAEWLKCSNPSAYLKFVQGFQMNGHQRINLRSKFHKGTDVPVPDDEYDRILQSMARARSAVASNNEPGGLSPSFKQTLCGPHAPDWALCRRQQFDDLQTCPPQPTLDIMDRCDAPSGIVISQTTWVNVTKMLPCGRVDKRKTRLCGRGDRECRHRDFDPMAISAMPVRFASVLMCFGIAAQLGLNCTCIDFSAAYTNAPMKRETWIYVPEGIQGVPTHDKDGQRRVAKVCNALFGFKASGAAWAELLDTKLRWVGGLKQSYPDAPKVSGKPVPGVTVTPCKSDPNVYRYDRGGEVCIVCAYSDDCLLFSSCPKLRHDIVESLKEFKLRDEGDAKAFLGMKIQKDIAADGALSYTLSMPGFVERLLKDNLMHEANPVSRPSSSAEKITDVGTLCKDAEQVRKCIGGLLWAAVTVRPDILSATNTLCRQMHCPTPMTEAGAKRVCRYLRGTINRGMRFSCDKPSLNNQKNLVFTAYSDADWGDDVDTGRSTSGHVLMMSGAAFANRSRLEKPVAMSSCESEAMAMCGCVQEIDFYRDFLGELKLGDQTQATTLYVDNRSAVLDAHNTTGRRTRHINLRFHRVRQSVRDRSVRILHVRGGVATDSMQVADVHTKATNTALFRKFSANIMGEVGVDCRKLPTRNE